jgi:hypothetical protein
MTATFCLRCDILPLSSESVARPRLDKAGRGICWQQRGVLSQQTLGKLLAAGDIELDKAFLISRLEFSGQDLPKLATALRRKGVNSEEALMLESTRKNVAALPKVSVQMSLSVATCASFFWLLLQDQVPPIVVYILQVYLTF